MHILPAPKKPPQRARCQPQAQWRGKRLRCARRINTNRLWSDCERVGWWIMGVLRAGAVLAWGNVCRIGSWGLREMGDPLLCLACIFAGVIGSSFLGSVLPRLPIAFEVIDLTRSPLTALVLAIVVFRIRAYTRWRAAQRLPLAARMIGACFEGATWMFCWRAYVYHQAISLGKLMRRRGSKP